MLKKRVHSFKLNYWLHTPSDHATTRKRYPVILFLHGSGERGDDLRKVLKHGPPKLIRQGYDLPCIVIAPQCPEGSWWGPHMPTLAALVEHVITDHRGNPRRVVCTGNSMGGYGTWELGAKLPELFSALLPICGGGEHKAGFPKAVDALKDMPIWAVHGALDTAVSVNETLVLTDRLRGLGANPQVTIHPKGKHDVWTRTYMDEAVWHWMLGQIKPLKN